MNVALNALAFAVASNRTLLISTTRASGRASGSILGMWNAEVGAEEPNPKVRA